MTVEQAYPGLAFRPRTQGWWARLMGHPPECVHLETEQHWMALLVPDKVYLRGTAKEVRHPARPEVSLCRACLLQVIEPELAAYPGRLVAFTPDPVAASQYFFLDRADFAGAGLRGDVAAAMEQRLVAHAETCETCERRATWLWFSRQEVASLDELDGIARGRGRWLCRAHGAAAFAQCLKVMDEANILYLNLPYGAAGAYVWI